MWIPHLTCLSSTVNTVNMKRNLFFISSCHKIILFKMFCWSFIFMVAGNWLLMPFYKNNITHAMEDRCDWMKITNYLSCSVFSFYLSFYFCSSVIGCGTFIDDAIHLVLSLHSANLLVLNNQTQRICLSDIKWGDLVLVYGTLYVSFIMNHAIIKNACAWSWAAKCHF